MNPDKYPSTFYPVDEKTFPKSIREFWVNVYPYGELGAPHLHKNMAVRCGSKDSITDGCNYRIHVRLK